MRDIDWAAAINIRRSARSYEERPVEETAMADLKSFVAAMEVPFKHDVQVRFFKAIPGSRLYYVKMAPPDNMAFMANTDIRSISAAGFVGELAILYATGLGLATCWYGHYVLEELERLMPHLGPDPALPLPKYGYSSGEVPGTRAICISPVGYWKKEGVRLFDRISESFVSYKRKPVAELLDGGATVDQMPTDIFYALDLARKAPSAGNSQPWRFTVSSDFKTIRVVKPVGYKHIKWEHPDVDIGICASHIWLGLKMKNVNCKVSLSEEQGRAIWRFDIIR